MGNYITTTFECFTPTISHFPCSRLTVMTQILLIWTDNIFGEARTDQAARAAARSTKKSAFPLAPIITRGPIVDIVDSRKDFHSFHRLFTDVNPLSAESAESGVLPGFEPVTSTIGFPILI